MPENKTPEELTCEFADYLHDKIIKIRENFVGETYHPGTDLSIPEPVFHQ